MTAIKPHLSAARLEPRYETAAEPIAKSHVHVLWLLWLGYDIDETVEVLSLLDDAQPHQAHNEGGLVVADAHGKNWHWIAGR